MRFRPDFKQGRLRADEQSEQEGCELSGAVRLVSVATPFGDVSLAGKPTLLCSFGWQFSGWVRDVAAPLTLAYTG